MAVRKLIEYLDTHNVKYVVIKHSPAFTTQEIAAKAHIPGKEMAKTVMVKVDGKLAMAVLPASSLVNFDVIREVVGAKNVELAHEEDFRPLFPDCEPGAMPPFGNLYGMDVYVAPRLAEDKEIAFNACSHTDLVRMTFADYQKLVQPKIFAFSIMR